MIKMYVMHTCPDCEYVEKQVEGNPDFEVIDIGKHVRNLKQFLWAQLAAWTVADANR